jgi:hypothetical protein
MQTQRAPRYGLWSAARFACAAGLCVATSCLAQGPSPKRDTPPAPPTSGSVISYQESRSAGIVYLEERGGLVSAVASPVKPANGAASPVAAAKVAPAAAQAAPRAAPAVAARKAPATQGKVAQAAASTDRARP